MRKSNIAVIAGTGSATFDVSAREGSKNNSGPQRARPRLCGGSSGGRRADTSPRLRAAEQQYKLPSAGNVSVLQEALVKQHGVAS